MLVLYTVTAFFYAITSQLIGSNSGFAASVGFLIVFFICFFVLISRDKISKYLIFGALGKQIIQGISVLMVALLVVASYVNQAMNIDFSRFRASGFGSGGSNSIDERIKLFKNNFIEHFSYNPVFGNVQIEVLTTGEGTYVHSLPFSLITHTGIVGFILFTLLLVVIYKEIVFSRAHPNINSLNANKNYGLFRLFTLTAVLVLSSISAHFIWIPLWFAIGLFGLSFVEKTSFKNE